MKQRIISYEIDGRAFKIAVNFTSRRSDYIAEDPACFAKTLALTIRNFCEKGCQNLEITLCENIIDRTLINEQPPLLKIVHDNCNEILNNESSEIRCMIKKLCTTLIQKGSPRKGHSQFHSYDFSSTEPNVNKAYFLYALKIQLSNLQWKNNGIGFFRHKTPNGILRLRKALERLPSICERSNSKILNEVFDEVYNILEEKQTPYEGLGRRLEVTETFYQRQWQLCQSISNQYPERKNRYNESYFEEGCGAFNQNNRIDSIPSAIRCY